MAHQYNFIINISKVRGQEGTKVIYYELHISKYNKQLLLFFNIPGISILHYKQF